MTLEKFDEKLKKVEMYIAIIISGVSAFTLMFLITADVIAKRGFLNPITGVYEMVQYIFMPLIVFPGLALCYSSNLLPKFDLLHSNIGKKANYGLEIFRMIVEILVFIIMFRFSFSLVAKGLANMDAVPMGKSTLATWPVYFLSPIGFGLLLLQVIVTRILNVKKFKKEAAETKKSEEQH